MSDVDEYEDILQELDIEALTYLKFRCSKLIKNGHKIDLEKYKEILKLYRLIREEIANRLGEVKSNINHMSDNWFDTENGIIYSTSYFPIEEHYYTQDYDGFVVYLIRKGEYRNKIMERCQMCDNDG